jgi:hypothetical protein
MPVHLTCLPNAGLRHLALEDIPADLTRLTQVTRFEARVQLRARPANLGPVAALPGLRHLVLLEADPCQADADTGALEAEQLLRLSTLTSLTQLRVELGVEVSELPALPALRSLSCRRARLRGCQLLSSCPQLTELDILTVAAAPEQQAAPPCLPQLQRAVLNRLCGLAELAPHLRHLTCYVWPEVQSAHSPGAALAHELSQLTQLRSLQLNYRSADDIGTALQQAVAWQCTRLVLRTGAWDLELLPACRAMHTLELCPNEHSWLGRMPGSEQRAARWLAAMQDSSVRELVCHSPNYWRRDETHGWLPLLAGWRSLRRLVLHSWLIPGSLEALAAACAREGSPLTRIELHHADRFQGTCAYLAWMGSCDAACASVERAHPAITCIAVRTAVRGVQDAYYD